MELILKKMRSDFDLVAKARLEAGEWSQADIKEFSEAIKACVDSGDNFNLALWARWLADLAAGVVFFKMVIGRTETAMRAAVAKGAEK